MLPGDRPKFRRIAETIADAIYAGRPAPGASLPSEPDLAHEHGVGMNTIRATVRTLRQWGLIATRHGERSRVVDLSGRRTIHEPPGTRVTSIPAGPRELRVLADAGDWDLELVSAGWPVLVVSRPDGSGDVFPADQVEIVVGDASVE